jgi:protein-disulfide isomerase
MKKIISIIFIICIIFPIISFSEETLNPLPGRVLGDESAQIIIEEYASMSCGHCASFHNNTLKKIKKKFIDTGKAQLIFYDFPLDRGAMIGSMITQCMNDNQFFPVLSMLFQKQTEWTQSDNILEAINTILAPLGLDKSYILSCLEESTDNQERWKSLLAGRKYAIDIKGVEATPTFFVNGQKVEGKFNIKKLKELIK